MCGTGIARARTVAAWHSSWSRTGHTPLMRDMATTTTQWAAEPSRCPSFSWGMRSMATPTPTPTPVTSRPLLLVVDDELPVLKVLERLAARIGFDVVTCASGADAMRTLMRKPADLAMVDLRMPD